MSVHPTGVASRGLSAYLLVLHLVAALAGTLFAGLALGGLAGETPMKVSSLLVALGWLALVGWALIGIGRGWSGLGRGELAGPLTSTRRWLTYLVWWAPVVGLLLAFVAFIDCGPLWIPNLFHWFGLTMTAIGLGALYSLPPLVRLFTGSTQPAAPSRPWWLIVVHCAGAALVWGLVWLIPYVAYLSDDVDPADYSGAPAGFLLPWRGGEDGWVIQGNNTGLNHNAEANGQDFAWDFRRSCGTAVLAAQAGTITAVVDTNDGIGGSNNLVEVTHADGTVGSYLHIRQGSATAPVGTAVNQGDALARVGCVGNSLTGHVHFHVRPAGGGATIAVRFDDVDDGVPRSFGSYTSGNR